MTDPRWQRIKDLFTAAAALDPHERAGLLDRECGDDPTLREEVESLLRAHPPNDAAAPDALVEGPGTRVGPYKLLEQIGEGGFGVVFLAEQEAPVRRRVALKVIKPGMDTRQVVARFEQERQALAMMDHPSIARVFDAGATASGRPFFVMELVRGDPITVYCDREKLTTQERLTLFAEVCRAVQHAHHKGVIHRDLKPNNVLVTIIDGKPVPKVIDFGVAKATQGRLTDKTLFTEHRQMIGTPLYMSPEQAQLSGVDVDTRSDVYSLGVLLYELLTGTPPFDQTQLLQAGIAEIHRMIRELEPPKPSTRVATLGGSGTSIAAQRRVEARKLGLLLRGDVDWIVMKCLEKERARRYDTASALAQDIDRHLAGEAIEAAPPSAVYRLGKFVRRKKGLVAASAAVALVAFAGIGATLWQAEAARQAEEGKASEAVAAAEIQRGLTADAERARGDAELARTRTEFEAYFANIAAADAALRVNDAATMRQRLDACPEQLRNWEWRYLDAQSDGANHVLPGRGTSFPAWPIGWIPRFGADGRRIVTAHRGTVRLWDTTEAVELQHLVLDDQESLRACMPLQGGLRVVTWSQKNGVRVCDRVPGNEVTIALPGSEHEPFAAVFSPDGARLATASDDGVTRVWCTTTWQLLAELPGERGVSFATLSFSYDGSRIAVVQKARSPQVYSVTDQRSTRLSGHRSYVNSCAFSRDGSRIATASDDGTARIWTADTGALDVELRGHGEPVKLADFSPDGRRVVTASEDRTARIWDVNTGREMVRLLGHTDAVVCACFSPDADLVATASWDNTARLWRATTGQQLTVLRGHRGRVTEVMFSPSGAQVATAAWDPTVRLWDVTTCLASARLQGIGYANQARFSRDGRCIVTDRYACDTATGHELAYPGAFANLRALMAVSAVDHRVVAVSYDGTATVHDLASGEEVALSTSREVEYAEFSPNGTHLVTTDGSVIATIWDTVTGAVACKLTGHQDQVLRATYDSSGASIATASRDGTVRLWNAATANTIRILPASRPVLDVRFAPDGDRLVLASRPGRVFDASTGQLLFELADSVTAFRDSTLLEWSPDGAVIVGRLDRDSARLWDSTTGSVIADLRGHTAPLNSVAFHPDGSRILTASGDGTARIWETQMGKELLSLRASEWQVNGACFSPDGTSILTAAKTTRVWDSVPMRGRAAETRAMGDAIESVRPGVLARSRDEGDVASRVAARDIRERLAIAVVLRDAEAAEERTCEQAIADLCRASAAADVVAAALQTTGSAAKRTPRNTDYRKAYGMALYRSGRYSEALPELQHVAAQHEEWDLQPPSDHAFLAMVHSRLGHRQEAESALAVLRERRAEELVIEDEPVAALLAEAESVFAAAFPNR